MTRPASAIIEETLRNVNRARNTSGISANTSSLALQASISASATVGALADSVQGSMRALNTAVDDIVGTAPAVIQVAQNAQVPIAQLTADASSISSALVRSTSTVRSDLEAITGSAAQATEGFIDVVISAPFPQAVGAALNQVSTAVAEIPEAAIRDLTAAATNLPRLQLSPVALQTLMSDVNLTAAQVTQKLDAALNSVVNDVLGATGIQSTLSRLKSTTIAQITNDLSNVLSVVEQGFGSIIENVVEGAFGNGAAALTLLAVRDGIKVVIPLPDQRRIFEALSAGNVTQAARLVQRFSDLDISQIEDTLRSINNKASNAINTSTANVAVTSRDLRTVSNEWNGVDTEASYFNNASVLDNSELTYDFANIDREVTELIIYSTNTGEDVFLTAERLHSISVRRDNKPLDAHYVINRTATIERGRPIELAADPNQRIFPNNHHQRSIVVVMVGGIVGPHPETGTSQQPQFSKNSYTAAQWANLDRILRAAYAAIPGLQVMGSRDIGAIINNDRGQGPHFDVPEYVASKFGKRLQLTNPQTQEPFTRQEIVSA